MGGADDAASPGSDELAEVTFSDSTANFKGHKISSSFFSKYFLNNFDFFLSCYYVFLEFSLRSPYLLCYFLFSFR